MTLNEAILKQYQKLKIVPTEYESVRRISTGSLALDYALGGGLPIGKYVELYGWESTGKTSLALMCAKSVLSLYREETEHVVFFDPETGFNADWARHMHGIDMSRFVYEGGNCAEDILDKIETVITDSHQCRLIIVDSIAGMSPRAELEGTMSDMTIGLYARRSAQFYRRISDVLSKREISVLFINQLRSKIGAMKYEVQYTTPGGKAKDFWAAIRIETGSKKNYPDKSLKDDESEAHLYKVSIKKNKTAPPGRDAEIIFRIKPPFGVDNIPAITTLGRNFDLFTKSDGTPLLTANSTWHYDGNPIGRGEGEVMEYLVDNDEMRERIIGAIYSRMGVNY